MLIRFTIFILLLLSMDGCKSTSQEKMTKNGMTTKTSLDSLQGYWVSIDDSLWNWRINGRNLSERYSDKDSTNTGYRIYFADTLVSGEKFNEIKIDTNKLSGGFVITKQKDNSIWCYEINGLGKDTLSLASTWANYRLQVFRRIAYR